MAPCLDALVGRLVLEAVQPAAIELAIAAESAEQDDAALAERQWKDRMAVAEEAARVAQLRFESVDPTNRLVASSLERDWEHRLSEIRALTEEHSRRKVAQNKTSHVEIDLIRELSARIPELWNAQATRNSDRQMVARQLIRQIEVSVVDDTELVDVRITWSGGHATRHTTYRPIARYQNLSNYNELKAFIVALWKQGFATPAIAERVNAHGFHTPRLLSPYCRSQIRQLLDRWGETEPMRAQVSKQDAELQPHEWWLMDLSGEVGIHICTLSRWIRRGWLHGRRATPKSKWWIAWADADECDRLRLLASRRNSGGRHPPQLTTPKRRDSD